MRPRKEAAMTKRAVVLLIVLLAMCAGTMSSPGYAAPQALRLAWVGEPTEPDAFGDPDEPDPTVRRADPTEPSDGLGDPTQPGDGLVRPILVRLAFLLGVLYR
jgi:hypothetical protein